MLAFCQLGLDRPLFTRQFAVDFKMFKLLPLAALAALMALAAPALHDLSGIQPPSVPAYDHVNAISSTPAYASVASASSPASSQILASPYPYVFPEQKFIGTTELFPMPLCNGIPLEEASIDDLRLALTIRKLNVTTLVGCYMDRITQVDRYVK